MYLLFDIGGSKMRLAISKGGKKLDAIKTIATPQNFQTAVLEFKKLALELSHGMAIKVAAGGVAGPLDEKLTQITNAPNLPHWNNKPLKKELEENIGTPVYLENDAAVAGLGEAVMGAGKKNKIVAYLTISTGVGGTRIIDGQIDRNALGFEPGHQIIDPTNTLCPDCRPPGYLENLISGSSLEHRFQKKPIAIADPQVWEQLAEWLAFGINNTIVHWSPEIVILGGPMIWGNPAINIERVRYHLKNICTIFPELPVVTTAELKDTAGLQGALILAKRLKK